MSTTSTPVIQTANLSVVIDRTTLLDGIDIRVQPGEWLCIIGPNGAGKSTLLRAIAGLIGCTGQVSINGVDMRTMHRRAIARQIAVVAQKPAVPSGATVADYVLLGRTPHLGPLHRESAADRLIAARAVKELDLGDFADRQLSTMSGGRVATGFRRPRACPGTVHPAVG